MLTGQLTVAIDFHSIFLFFFLIVNSYCQLSGLQYPSKHLILFSTEERNRFGKTEG